MDTLTDWNINLQDFEAGGWGNTSGEFNPPEWYKKRYTTTGASGTYNKEKAFKEFARKIIDVIKASKSILNRIRFSYGNAINTGFDENTKAGIRRAVYIGIQEAIENDNIFERISGLDIKIGSSSMKEDGSGFDKTYKMLGRYAWNALQNSGIDQYKLVSEDVYYNKTMSGNIEIRGKISIEKLQEL